MITVVLVVVVVYDDQEGSSLIFFDVWVFFFNSASFSVTFDFFATAMSDSYLLTCSRDAT